ncbi:hypothetical protein I553_3637 [Mycobacterium xenopi 4042]|uniref:Uncharacterized protein n=1 Tax=Mycobacterium xenopi 4042 TaxID=1299334 RepID=X7ZCE4_MYCXE|nr:hypothetical protein I553_3637 [Mycobacterium xenopi 4042]
MTDATRSPRSGGAAATRSQQMVLADQLADCGRAHRTAAVPRPKQRVASVKLGVPGRSKRPSDTVSG